MKDEAINTVGLKVNSFSFIRKLCFILVVHTILNAVNYCHAGVGTVNIYVSPDGDDSNDGSEDSPMKSLGRALQKYRGSEGEVKLIFREGEYVCISPNKIMKNKKVSKLFVEAYPNEKVVFRGDRKIYLGDLEELDKRIYLLKGNWGHIPPMLFYSEKRVRFKYVSDLNAVKHKGNTMTILNEEYVAFHLGKELGKTKYISIGQSRSAFYSNRDHVYFKNLTFKNFIRNKWCSGIEIDGKYSSISHCNFENINQGVIVSPKGFDTKVLKCNFKDVGSGVYTEGENTVIEYCNIFKEKDSFEVPVYVQDDKAIQFYYPGKGGVVRYNTFYGFQSSVIIKSHKSKYIFENNILYDGIALGGGRGKGDDILFKKNIIGLDKDSHQRFKRMKKIVGTSFRENAFFRKDLPFYLQLEKKTFRVGGKSSNIYTHPQFKNVKKYNFKIRNKSQLHKWKVGTVLSNKNKKGNDLSLIEFEPVFSFMSPGDIKEYRERDSRMKDYGKINDFKNKLKEKYDYFVQSIDLNWKVHYGSDIKKGRYKFKIELNDKTWIESCRQTLKIKLPNKEGRHILKVYIQKSKSKEILISTKKIYLSLKDPELQELEVLRNNAYGYILKLKTDKETLALLEQDQRAVYTKLPSREHFIKVCQKLGKAKEIEVNLLMKDLTGRMTTISRKLELKEKSVKTFELSAKDHAKSEKVSLSRVMEQTLPGDTVLLSEGIFEESFLIHHKGFKEAPLIIQGAGPFKTIFEGYKEKNTLIHLRRSYGIHLKDFGVRGFVQSGIYSYECRNIELNNLNVINHQWNGWPVGIAIYFNTTMDCTVIDSTISRSERAFFATDCSGLIIYNNTITSCLLEGIYLVNSCFGTSVYNNALCFTGNSPIKIIASDKDDLEGLYLDYNNYATTLRKKELDRGRPSIEPKNKQYYKISKAIVAYKNHSEKEVRFKTLKDWVDFSNKDKHTIFKDPQFIAPWKNRYDVLPSSPNLDSGYKGGAIGARGTLGFEFKSPITLFNPMSTPIVLKHQKGEDTVVKSYPVALKMFRIGKSKLIEVKPYRVSEAPIDSFRSYPNVLISNMKSGLYLLYPEYYTPFIKVDLPINVAYSVFAGEGIVRKRKETMFFPKEVLFSFKKHANIYSFEYNKEDESPFVKTEVRYKRPTLFKFDQENPWLSFHDKSQLDQFATFEFDQLGKFMKYQPKPTLSIKGSRNRKYKFDTKEENLDLSSGILEFYLMYDKPANLNPQGVPIFIPLAKKTQNWNEHAISFYKNSLHINNGQDLAVFDSFGLWDSLLGMTSFPSKRWFHLAFHWEYDSDEKRIYTQVFIDKVPQYPKKSAPFSMNLIVEPKLIFRSDNHRLSIGEMKLVSTTGKKKKVLLKKKALKR